MNIDRSIFVDFLQNSAECRFYVNELEVAHGCMINIVMLKQKFTLQLTTNKQKIQ